MAGRPLVEGTKSLIVFMLRAVIFPLTWLWALGIAKRYLSTDSAARSKVIVAIVAGLVAAPAIGYMIYDFQEESRVNMYSELEVRFNQHLGSAAYNDQVATTGVKATQMGVLGGNLGLAQARMNAAAEAGDVAAYELALADRVALQGSLATATHEHELAQLYTSRLMEENVFFMQLSDSIRGQDDGAMRAAIAARAAAFGPGQNADVSAALLDAEKALASARGEADQAAIDVLGIALLADIRELTDDEHVELAALETARDETAAKLVTARDTAETTRNAAIAVGLELPVPANVFEGEKIVSRSNRDLAIKSKAEIDMANMMNGLIYPGLIGVFYAPLFFALGNIMSRNWEPSESVGFKKYPGASLGLFLFFGAFGWPSLLFSAWGFKDIEERTQTGQINL